VRLELTTAHDNLRAQALYTSEGWQHDEVFRTYTLTLALE
jgi:RimJ/RimL family protein N-acetyltransferase